MKTTCGHRVGIGMLTAWLLARTCAAASSVWVVSNGFHSSIGIPASALPSCKFPAARGADFLLLGWGDADWYRGHVTPGTFCSAVFWPTPSVLHVVAVRGRLSKRFRHSDVVRIELTPAQLLSLAVALDQSFARDEHGRLRPAGKGFQPGSEFFKSCESFYFPKMCNYWIAEKLRNSGLRLSVVASLSASGLVRQAALVGLPEQARGGPADYF
ncbi:MAG: hypothetical protein QOD99_2456 [Chthoniobacter sp.]|jgi:uncharacterized protein (TIGR02117 family)|nr:hypothetical protein [Chthoniobacter sp.]